MAQSLHPQASAILARLQQEGVSEFYHITSVENLPGICQMQALCSKKILEEVQSIPTTTGGNLLSHNLDQRWGNWNRVCLSFTPHIPTTVNGMTPSCLALLQLILFFLDDSLTVGKYALTGEIKNVLWALTCFELIQ